MKVLLDTNIVIHREASRILNVDIGVLFRWLDKGKYIKCVHPITIQEIEKNSNQETAKTLGVKLESYEVLKTTSPLLQQVIAVSDSIDVNQNDKNGKILIQKRLLTSSPNRCSSCP